MKTMKPVVCGLRLNKIDYVKLSPKPELDGKLGLHSHEIARSLGVEHKFMTQKVRRGRFLEMCAKQNFVVVANATTEIPSSYVFDEKAAKAFVAKWDNEQGWGYLAFLLACEQVVDKAEKEVSMLKDLVKRLTLRQPRRIKGVMMVTKTTIVKHKDLFGQQYYLPIRERVPYSDLEDEGKREYRLKHRNRVMEGLQRRQSEDFDSVLIVPSQTKLLSKENQ